MKNIVILISGNGSNMAAIVRAAQTENWQGKLGVRVAAVISNRLEAPGLLLATSMGIATHTVSHRNFDSREAFDAAMLACIAPYAPHLVVLAGFMRI